jgi:hypothetical protein
VKILFLLLLSLPALACNNPVSIVEAQKAVDSLPFKAHDCKWGEVDCLCYDTVDWRAAEIVDNYVNGTPIYTINSQVSCLDEADCKLKQSELVCDEVFVSAYRLDNPQAYCFRLDGYEQVLSGKKLQNNSTKLAQALAQEAARAQLEAGIQVAQRLRACGERVMALMLVRNQPKNLTTAQVKQLVSSYAGIKGLLESGSLNSAKEEIQAAVADGVLITNADKAALSAEIDKCLGN